MPGPPHMCDQGFEIGGESGDGLFLGGADIPVGYTDSEVKFKDVIDVIHAYEEVIGSRMLKARRPVERVMIAELILNVRAYNKKERKRTLNIEKDKIF